MSIFVFCFLFLSTGKLQCHSFVHMYRKFPHACLTNIIYGASYILDWLRFQEANLKISFFFLFLVVPSFLSNKINTCNVFVYLTLTQ